MRLVLDTNVLISAFISRGLCSQVLEHCAKHHELVSSSAIIEEMRQKLLTKFRMAPPAVDRAVAALFFRDGGGRSGDARRGHFA